MSFGCVFRGKVVGRTHTTELHQCFVESKMRTCTVGTDVPGLPNCVKCSLRNDGVSRRPLFVDVVITSHNYGNFLGEALDSLVGQPQTGKVIVVDDSSDADDQTKAICEARGVEYMRVEFRDAHLSRGAGFARCSSKLIHFLDADNTLPAGYLAEAAKLFASDARLAIVYPDLHQFGGGTFKTNFPSVGNLHDLERGNYADTGSVWLREALLQVDAFGHNHRGWEDWGIARDIMRSGQWHAQKHPLPLNYRIHEKQRTFQAHVVEKRPYWMRAGLLDETVAVFMTVSSRVMKNRELWDRRKKWLREQTWPVGQIRLFVANTSGESLPADWFDDLPEFSGVTSYAHKLPVGVETIDRRKVDVEAQVQTICGAIYNRAFREIPESIPYVLVLEDDVFPEQLDTIERLMKSFDHDVASVGGAYQQRYSPYGWTMVKSIPAGGRPMLPSQPGKGVERTFAGTGFGCVLFRTTAVNREVWAGNIELTPYYDAAGYSRLVKEGRKCLIDWDVRCEHYGMEPARTKSTFMPCANLGDIIRTDKCEICGSAAGPKGTQVQVRECSAHGECAPARYRQKDQPHVCNMACRQFEEKLVQLTVGVGDSV